MTRKARKNKLEVDLQVRFGDQRLGLSGTLTPSQFWKIVVTIFFVVGLLARDPQLLAMLTAA